MPLPGGVGLIPALEKRFVLFLIHLSSDGFIYAGCDNGQRQAK